MHKWSSKLKPIHPHHWVIFILNFLSLILNTFWIYFISVNLSFKDMNFSNWSK